MKNKHKNQFYQIKYGFNISEIKAKTKRKNAFIKIDIPEELADKLLKQLTLNKLTPISGLELSWNDSEVEEE